MNIVLSGSIAKMCSTMNMAPKSVLAVSWSISINSLVVFLSLILTCELIWTVISGRSFSTGSSEVDCDLDVLGTNWLTANLYVLKSERVL